jgi:hypothetical protein
VYGGQRVKIIEEDCIGNQGSKRTVVLEEEEGDEEEGEEEEGDEEEGEEEEEKKKKNLDNLLSIFFILQLHRRPSRRIIFKNHLKQKCSNLFCLCLPKFVLVNNSKIPSELIKTLCTVVLTPLRPPIRGPKFPKRAPISEPPPPCRHGN